MRNVVCTKCGDALPSLDAAVAVRRFGGAYSSIYTSDFSPAHTPPIDPLTITASASPVCRCVQNCGSLYCSRECRSADVQAGHGLICVGPVDQEHPLYKFRLQAVQAEVPELAMVAILVARFVKNRDVPLQELCEGLPPWWELGGDGGEYDEFDLEEEGRVVERFQLVHEAFHNLSTGMPGMMTCRSNKEIDVDMFGQLLSFVTQYAVRIEPGDVVSKLAHFCTVMLPSMLSQQSVADRQETIDALQALLIETAEMGFDEADDGGSGDEAAGGDEASPPLSLHDLLTRGSVLFPGPTGLAIYPAMFEEKHLRRMPHACLPSCKVAFATSALTLEASLTWRLQAPPSDSLPWTRSAIRLDQDMEDVGERQYCVAAVTGTICTCLRCAYESGGSTTALPLADLHELARLAQEDGRHKDAITIFGHILARAPDDGEALYGTVRVMSWDDAWEESVQFLTQACVRSDDARLKERSADIGSYYPMAAVVDGADGAPVAPVTGEMFAQSAIEQVFVSQPRAPLLDPVECKQAVADVEAYLQDHGGWSTSRHYAVPTTDVAVRSVPNLLRWFNKQLAHRLFPALSVLYGVRVERLRVIDAFVVKYDSKKQRSLPRHVDQSEYSFTVALNDCAEYEGGGTFFAHPPAVLNCSAGGVVVFPGDTEHAGYPIFAGTRYIIAVFAYAEGVQ